MPSPPASVLTSTWARSRKASWASALSLRDIEPLIATAVTPAASSRSSNISWVGMNSVKTRILTSGSCSDRRSSPSRAKKAPTLASAPAAAAARARRSRSLSSARSVSHAGPRASARAWYCSSPVRSAQSSSRSPNSTNCSPRSPSAADRFSRAARIAAVLEAISRCINNTRKPADRRPCRLAASHPIRTYSVTASYNSRSISRSV